ncbi:M28 family metallopeptidase [Kallotenue papyrolyticum]|uniref:M28 family metallopeptidase n=1 Tax=Kallotenue papyrolyticum TaxID=1325125 RepID=UPI0004785602|nr:M28 family peptidase [Kallotenue papyrolyticum]
MNPQHPAPRTAAPPGVTPVDQRFALRALEHIRYLTETIGPRPSTGTGERRAAEYVAVVWQRAGLEPRIEPFLSGRSTYRPYALAFAAGLLGTLIGQTRPTRSGTLPAALLNAAGAWAFFREAELSDHWARRLLPRGPSQNVVAIIPPTDTPRHRVVLYGHLDTHRTPIFYSSPLWLRAFSSLVGACFAGLLLQAINNGWAALRGRAPAKLTALAATGVQLFGLTMTLHADRTPFTPGANDNASGAASVLALGERLADAPLRYTEVWVVANGCEELGAYGIRALLDAHATELRDADLIALDMVGIGAPTLLLREGLLLPSRPDPQLLSLAREVAARHPGLLAGEHQGGAYTDTGMVTRRGFRGLTIDSQIPPGHPAAAAMGYWHQMSDTFDKIEPTCLARAHAFVWALLQEIDRRSSSAPQATLAIARG